MDLDDAGLALGGRVAALGALDHAGRGDAHAATSKTVLAWPERDAFGRVLDGLLVGAQRPAAVDQATGLERLGELQRAREVVLVAVGALDLELRSQAAARSAFSSPGMPTSTTRPRARVIVVACSRLVPLPTQSSTRSKPPSNISRPK